MPANPYPIRANFGLLPEPERHPASLVTSAMVNLAILAVVLYIGLTAKHVIEQHKYEQTELVFPTAPPPPIKVKMPPPPKIEPPKPMEMKLEAPKINLPRFEPKPDLKPVQMEAKVALPVIKAATLAFGVRQMGASGISRNISHVHLLLYCGGTIGAVLVISTVSYYWFESPLRRVFRKRNHGRALFAGEPGGC